MLKNLSGARLGIFVFLGTALLIISVFLIGNKESLFASTFTIKSRFETVEGLRSGATVRLSGITVGSVSGIEIANDTTGNVIVSMRVRTDVKEFIRLDSKASVETEGLVGDKIIILSVGSPRYAEVKDGGFLVSKPPVNMSQVIEEGQATLNNLNVMSKDFAEIISKINNGEGSIGKLVNDQELYNSTVKITKSADKSLGTITARFDEISKLVFDATEEFQGIVVSLDSVVKKVDYVLNDVKNGKGLLGSLLAEESNLNDSVNVMVKNLVTTTEGISIGAARFAENMEALKHNWLFKNYFEERGYWDVTEYQKNVDSKIAELKERTRELDQKIKELKDLEERTSGASSN